MFRCFLTQLVCAPAGLPDTPIPVGVAIITCTPSAGRLTAVSTTAPIITSFSNSTDTGSQRFEAYPIGGPSSSANGTTIEPNSPVIFRSIYLQRYCRLATSAASSTRSLPRPTSAGTFAPAAAEDDGRTEEAAGAEDCPHVTGPHDSAREGVASAAAGKYLGPHMCAPADATAAYSPGYHECPEMRRRGIQHWAPL